MINHGIDQHQHAKLVQSALLTERDFQAIRSTQSPSYFYIESDKVKAILDIDFVPNDICIIDWVNFTFSANTFSYAPWFIAELSTHLKFIFGFPITEQRPNGAYMYKDSYILGDKYGLVCHGGQENSVLVSINGVGLTHAKKRWQPLLHAFLTDAENARITRIDLAHDDFTGERFNIETIVQAYEDNLFNNGNRKPSITQYGNWLENDGTGRTFAVGKRANGIYFRGYDKGAQLKSEEFPNWFRCEVELKSTNRIIPFDVLENPHLYFAGSFPIFNGLADGFKKIDTFKNEIYSDLTHRINWGRRQLGGLIKLMLEKGYTPTGIVKELGRDELPQSFIQKFLSSSNEEISAFVNDEFLLALTNKKETKQ